MSIDKWDWRELEPLLDQLLDTPPIEREQKLLQLTHSKPELSDKLRSLLQASENESSRFDSRLEDTARDFVTQFAKEGEASTLAGRNVGPYRLVKPIARGGMGMVFEGARADGAYEQRVAIKLLPIGLAAGEFHERFVVERQILAQLSHSNIAQLIDGGVTEDQTPYFVMEYVDGVSLTDHCQQFALGVADRLSLFRRVCGAVSFAHQNLVLHRDIKPANVLVTPDGVPKLLDFGVSRILTQPDQAVATQAVGMTLAYASPEQLSGQPVSTLSDVYSLGVMLYELLTNYLPYDVSGLSPAAVESLVAAGRAQPLSERVVDSDQKRELSGDLEAIVTKAMEADTVRRYTSVQALVDDLDNFQQQRPVTAQKNSWWYRTRKFLRRHRMGTGITAGVALLSIIGVISLVWQMQQTQRQAERAERVSGFFENVFDAANPFGTWDEEKSVQDLLNYADSQATKELGSDPEILANMQNLIGVAHLGLGKFDRAKELLVAALATQQRLFGARSMPAAQSANNLSWAHIELGEYEQAVPLAQQAVEVYTNHQGRASVEVADAITNLAVARSFLGNKDEAYDLHNEALDIRRELLPHQDPRIADSLVSIAAVVSAQGDQTKALELNREAEAIYQTALGSVHPLTLRAKNGVAAGLFGAHDYAGAEAAFAELVSATRSRLGEDHPELVLMLNNLGRVQTEAGKFFVAAENLAEAYRLAANLEGNKVVRISAEFNYAAILAETNQTEKALPLLKAVVQKFAELTGPNHPLVWRSQVQLARLYWLEGQAEEALLLIEELMPKLDKYPTWSAEIYAAKARLQLHRGQKDAALVNYEKALGLYQTHLPQKHWRLREVVFEKAVIAGSGDSERHLQEVMTFLPPGSTRRSLAKALIAPAG